MKQSAFLYILFFALVGLSTSHCTNSSNPKILPLKEGYQPDHKIEFSHELHAQIDCKYCHNSKTNGKTESLQTTSICMKCHKQIKRNK